MRILLVDDPSAAQAIEWGLRSESFKVYSVDTGEEAVDLGKLYDYDLILLDPNSISDIHGFDVIRRLRAAKIRTPILVLTDASYGVSDVSTALTLGADDYVAKPFQKEELVARIHALIRRSRGHVQAIITTGSLSVNLDLRTVSVAGHEVHVTFKEYLMLELLALRKGMTVTKEMFLDHLYGGRDEPELKIVDVFLCKLRKKLRAAGCDGHVQTVWGRGYTLRDPSSETSIPCVKSPPIVPAESVAA